MVPHANNQVPLISEQFLRNFPQNRIRNAINVHPASLRYWDIITKGSARMLDNLLHCIQRAQQAWPMHVRLYQLYMREHKP